MNSAARVVFLARLHNRGAAYSTAAAVARTRSTATRTPTATAYSSSFSYNDDSTTTRRWFGSGDSITYSGGHASEGQGGFYGSGGARVGADDSHIVVDKNRQQLLALQADVDRILQIMNQVEELETALTKEDDRLSSKSMELKNAMKKLLTAPDVLESLNRLEVQGQPTWGLSTEERELIILAREKMNES